MCGRVRTERLRGIEVSRSPGRRRARWPPAWREPCCQAGGLPGSDLPGGSGDERRDNIRGVPVQRSPGPVVPDRGARVGVRGRFLHVPQRHAGIERGCDERMPSVWGPIFLARPARRASRRTIRPAPCRSSRAPAGVVKIGPSHRSPTARSIARAVLGASGMTAFLPPLRMIARVRWPRSVPSASTSAPVASDTRSPFRASSEIRACSAADPRPAATSRAPTSLRSSPAASDSHSSRGRRTCTTGECASRSSSTA
jgi:hypothetical protein